MKQKCTPHVKYSPLQSHYH